VAVVA
jgi:hypothetical protein